MIVSLERSSVSRGKHIQRDMGNTYSMLPLLNFVERKGRGPTSSGGGGGGSSSSSSRTGGGGRRYKL